MAVRAAITTNPTPRIAVDCITLIYISEGSSLLMHEDGAVEVATGDVVVIPDGYWCAGTPYRELKTLTLYVDTEFLIQQSVWITPLQQLLLNLDLHDTSTQTLHVLKLAQARVQSIGKHLQMLAARQLASEQDFAFLARLADVFDALSAARPD